MTTAPERVRSHAADDRQQFLVDVFVSSFRPLMESDPGAWRGKFRKMAATPFAFYRGSAAIFYADMADEDDSFSDERTPGFGSRETCTPPTSGRT